MELTQHTERSYSKRRLTRLRMNFTVGEQTAFQMAVEAIRGLPLTLPLILDGKFIGLLRSENNSRAVWFSPFTDTSSIMTALYANQRTGQIWYKNVAIFSPLATRWYDLWCVGGDPQGGSYTGTAATARPLDNTVVGGLAHGPNVSPLNKHIISGWAHAFGQPNVSYVYDRVLTYESLPLTSTTTTMTNTLPAQRYNGSGLPGMLLFPTLQTTLSFAGSGAFATLTYVDQGGASSSALVTSANSGIDTHSTNASNTVPAQQALNNSGSFFHPFLPLAAGDTGARSITSFTVASVASSGLMCMVLMRPLLLVANSSSLNPSQFDFLRQWVQMPIVVDGAHISMMTYFANSSSPWFQGSLDFVWG